MLARRQSLTSPNARNWLSRQSKQPGPARETTWQSGGDALNTVARACRPNCRRAFVRFSQSQVIRNLFLLDIPRGFRKDGERSLGNTRARVLSKTAGAGKSRLWGISA